MRAHRAARAACALPLLLSALLGGLPGAAPAQDADFTTLGGPEVPERLAAFSARIQPETARPGEHVRLEVTADVEDGWYIYSVVPQESEFAPPPTELSVEPGPLTTEGPVYETNPTEKVDQVFGMKLAFHPNAARLYQNLRVPADAAPGRVEVPARVRYQVCNSTYCTPPRSEDLQAALRVEEGPVRPAFAYMERSVDYVDGAGNIRRDAGTLEGALSGGLLGFLALAAGFGLLALLTPCVFPMIPVTVSFFTGASERNHGSVLRLALLFAGGIVAAYTGLGLLLTFLLGATGVTQFATNPWVNLAVAGFFALFALNLMGLLDFRAPGGLVQRLNRASYHIKGPAGVLIMGVAFTATSFTCTMPFVGTLLVAATQGQVFWPLVGMLVFSGLFALPFFLLALFPRYVVRLRGRSGPWLVQLKVALGLLELLAALKFASNADLVWQWGVLDRNVLLAAGVVIVGAAALTLAGLLPWPGLAGGRTRGPARAAGAGVLLAVAVYFGLGLSGRGLDSYTESYLPPALDQGLSAGMRASGVDYVAVDAVHALPWQPSLEAGLARARETGKPVFVDFTGYTCINCRWMERKVFAAQPVYEAFRERFVLVQLYTDGGEHAERNRTLQAERFRTLALPYYVILSPDNAVLAKHAGIMPEPQDFLRFLEGAARRLQDDAAAHAGEAGAPATEPAPAG